MKKLLYLLIFISCGASAQRSISLKVASVDTSLAFANYIRTANYGTVKTLQALGVDTTLISTKANVTAKLIGYAPLVSPSFTTPNIGVATATSLATGAISLSDALGTTLPALTLYNSTTAAAGNISQILFRTRNVVGGNEVVASITASNPNAATNNGGQIVLATSLNGAATTPTARLTINNDGSAVFAQSVQSTGKLYVGTTSVYLDYNGGGLDFGIGGVTKLNLANTTGNATFSGSASILSSTASSSTSTGALVVTGGIGVAGTSFFGSTNISSAAITSLVVGGAIGLNAYTVATLPSAATAGYICYVTDALSPTYGATVAGGGAVKTLVMSDGSAWKVH